MIAWPAFRRRARPAAAVGAFLLAATVAVIAAAAGPERSDADPGARAEMLAHLARTAGIAAGPLAQGDRDAAVLVLQAALRPDLSSLGIVGRDGQPVAEAGAPAADAERVPVPIGADATLIAFWTPPEAVAPPFLLPALAAVLAALLGALAAWLALRAVAARQSAPAGEASGEAELKRELERQREVMTNLTTAYNQLLIEHASHGHDRQLERRRFFDDIERQKSELLAARDAALTEAMTRSRFFAGMTHELRTPMNAIMGFSEAIERQIFGPDAVDRYSDYARDIRVSAQHLLDTINQLLDMAKAESGKLELDSQPLNVGGVVDDCISMLHRLAENRGIRLERLISPSMAPYTADKRMLRQILINLISNAIKFSPEGGRVLIEAGPDLADDLQIRVRDFGKGIAAEDLPRVFEPYVQGRIKGSEPGTGLGLPLSRTFARLHGGELSLESEVGEGTVATIGLPSWRWDRNGGEPDDESFDDGANAQQVAGHQTSGWLSAQLK
ncbi:MAG: sensor histidine kinase [Minwuia sp.]|uniref:sensor histidine kinase n=1 Tax=Minwuia sp. TaxID=2493630 RepID=UPI003A8392AA